MAHELETRLADGENSAILLVENIELLRRNLIESEFQTSEDLPKISLVNSINRQKSGETNDFSAIIPAAIRSQLSNQEKKITGAAFRTGKQLFVLEIAFESASFADELINFREKTEATGKSSPFFRARRLAQEQSVCSF